MSAGQEVVRLNDDFLDITIRLDQSQFDAQATEALERNPQIAILKLTMYDPTCLRNWPRLLQHLEMRNNLHKLVLTVWMLDRRVPAAADMSSLLQTLQRNTNIQIFKFHGSVPVGPLVSFLNAGSTRLTTVSLGCFIANDDNNSDGPALLAASIECLTNLQSLNLDRPLQTEYFAAIFGSLERTQSVQTLQINLNQANQSVLASLTSLMRSTSTIRELVIVRGNVYASQTLLAIAKSNFSLREIRFRGPEPYLACHAISAEDRRLLRFYTNRNECMDKWIEQPSSVPKPLWSHALNVAAQARDPSVLFRCLLAISGDLAPAKLTRKRKRPTYYKPA